MEMCTAFQMWLNVKKHLFLNSSGEELFLMSALVRLPFHSL